MGAARAHQKALASDWMASVECGKARPIPTVPKKLIYQTVRGEMRAYALKHGPSRKDPLPFSTIARLSLLCHNMGWSALQWNEESAQSLKALINVAAKSGMRKVELSSNRAVFGNVHQIRESFRLSFTALEVSMPRKVALVQYKIPSNKAFSSYHR